MSCPVREKGFTMNSKDAFMMLTDSGYFYACSAGEDQFIGCSTLNDVLWKVNRLAQGGFSVWNREYGTGAWIWQLNVAGITSIFGVVTDAEDDWLKKAAKEKQKKPKSR